MSSRKSVGLIAMAMSIFGVGDIQVRKHKAQLPNPKPIIQNGHKEFVINGEAIYALNLKNAQKKYWSRLGEKPWNNY